MLGGERRREHRARSIQNAISRLEWRDPRPQIMAVCPSPDVAGASNHPCALDDENQTALRRQVLPRVFACALPFLGRRPLSASATVAVLDGGCGGNRTVSQRCVHLLRTRQRRLASGYANDPRRRSIAGCIALSSTLPAWYARRRDIRSSSRWLRRSVWSAAG